MKNFAATALVACGLALSSAGATIAADQNDVAAWMLVVTPREGVSMIAPTTYQTPYECAAVASTMSDISGFRGHCIPAKMTEAFVADYTAKKEAEDAAFEQLARDLPALKAEREAIEAVSIEKRTKAQMDRLEEIRQRLSGIIE